MSTDLNRRDYIEQAPPVIASIAEMAISAAKLNRSDAMSALADCERALRRVVKRATTLLDEFERVEIKQARGPTYEFTGRLLCDSEFETRGPDALRIEMEVWETEGGAYVAASCSTPVGGGNEEWRAVVIPPTDEIQSMRFAVLEFFNWDQRARSMCTKQLKWSLRQEVE